jgi:hypothetical protein
MPATEAATTCIYEIEADDTICYVNAAWPQFARGNGATSLETEDVIGQVLWSFVEGMDLQQFYREVVGLVRKTKRPMALQFRCDAPDRTRLHEMTVSTQSGNRIRFECVILNETPRSYVPLLDATVARTDEFLVICSMCKRLEVARADWRELVEGAQELRLFERLRFPQLSHGLCPVCAADQERMFQNLTDVS